MTNYPSRHVAELVALTKPHGCIYEGVARSGHAQIRLPNGEVYTTSATPSDVNATSMAWHDIRRKLGIADGRRSGKHRKGITRVQFVPTETRVESVSAQYAQLQKQHREACDRIGQLQALGASSDSPEALEALQSLLAVEAACEHLGRRAPLRTFRIREVAP